MPARIIDHRWTSYSDTASDSGCSDISEQSQSTAPTVYSRWSRPPSFKYHETPIQPYNGHPWCAQPDELLEEVKPHDSVVTYASTVASEDDWDEDLPSFEVPDEPTARLPSTAIPSTPSEFAEVFPSTRRLQIRHDDSTVDGNMNLRVDTEVRSPEGRRLDLTLFHLRMHDLKNREFSFRRYCRDSGREVCHSSRKYSQPSTMRSPGLQRSMSNALSTLRFKSESRSATKTSLQRSDSGYGSLCEEDCHVKGASPKGRTNIPIPTNTTHLEFSNYAHIDIKRRGTKSSKRYDFEYWGTKYAWKRLDRKIGNMKEISYHLMHADSSRTIAHIVPDVLTDAELFMEDAKGGWIPPSSLWISDANIARGRTDVAE